MEYISDDAENIRFLRLMAGMDAVSPLVYYDSGKTLLDVMTELGIMNEKVRVVIAGIVNMIERMENANAHPSMVHLTTCVKVGLSSWDEELESRGFNGDFQDLYHVDFRACRMLVGVLTRWYRRR